MGTNTGIGIGIGIPFKNNALGGDRPYLPPELKARLIGVWDNYGKKNTDADRNIIKNKIPNTGGDLEILNSAYRLNSGFGGYSNDFQEYTYSENIVVKDNTNAIFNSGGKLLVPYSHLTKGIPSFKIKVSGLSNTYHFRYYYRDSNGVQHSVDMVKDGNYELPICYNVQSSSDGTDCGFANYGSDIVSVEILPKYEGAFVTDGVNDMIISQKTLQEMGVTKDFTIVSMIHQITLRSATDAALTNYIRQPIGHEYVRNHVANIGKTGIYGYAVYDVNHSNANNSHVINTILGDKNDYSIHIIGNLSQGKFSVQGYINGDNNIVELSQVAWYWTFIANGVLTTDEINQVIAYYNLDKYVKPDIYYNVKKQGLTNDNHTQFGDKLIDYSGNSRDLQLFNIGWNPGSGIGKYVTNFGIWSKDAESNISYNSYSFTVNGSLKRIWLMWYVSKLPSFKIKVSGINSNGYVDYGYYDNGSLKNFRLDKDGIHTLPPSGASSNDHGFKVNDTSLDWTGLVIEQIPDFAGVLCFDGVDDYGQFVGDLGLKDYTVVIDRAYPIVSTPQFTATSDATGENVNTPFLIEHRDVNANECTYSYLSNTVISINKEREICYQSTYQYKDTVINKGSSTSLGTGLTIARYGINNGYSALALYSFMLFHYSMSKFLIERQLKKYKTGTLYKDMVEFRPIIKSNIDVKNIVYLDKDSNVIKVGDYVSIGNNIKTSITVLDGYKISKVSSTAFNNITIEKSNTDFIYDVIFYGIKKSPQKINLVIEQDSDYVQWNPNIKANVSKYSVTANIRKTDGTTLKLVNGQFYSTSIIGNLVLDIVPPYKDSDEVTNVVIDGKSYTPTKDSSGNYYRLEIPLVFPKDINITIQEYVRYEDIVQPYPVLLRFKDENNNEISWGDKIKLGSSITRIGSFNDYNLLKDIYTVSNAKLNGNPLTSTPHVVERQMVFTCTATWIFDDNEPNCILSPRLLHAPNSSYKILGHIPDISGHGNNGVIHNSAYAEGSGVNEDGSYQFDGVDDFVTIPTTVGGKQVLMKVNWNGLNHVLYDQRNNAEALFCIAAASGTIAYNQRNVGGNTYIDGILNNHILVDDLQAITHNIVLNNDYNVANSNSFIGTNYTKSIYAKMSLYDFMLFDNISTDDKIKELNEYVGIEAKVELPPYYWDTYGKTNSDADRDTIQQRGIAVGDYNLTNTNFAYDKMSGFGGYALGKFTNSWSLSNNSNSISIVARNPYDITLKKLGENIDWEFNSIELKIISNPVSVKFKSDKNIRFTCDYHYYTVDENSRDTPLEIISKDLIANEDTIITISPISQENIDKYNIDISRGYYLIYFQLSLTLVVNEEVTIEMLPLYPNGLVYDGVSDFTNNKNIPILTDFTFIIKREILGLETNDPMLVIKGDKVYNNGIGNAFILEHNNNGVNYVYSYGKLNQIKRDDSKIIYLTPESYNGNPIIKGENGDNLGLILSRYWKGIIYKTILYSKTISLLEINFLKNLMEKDEIIDLNNPIFIKNE